MGFGIIVRRVNGLRIIYCNVTISAILAYGYIELWGGGPKLFIGYLFVM